MIQKRKPNNRSSSNNYRLGRHRTSRISSTSSSCTTCRDVYFPPNGNIFNSMVALTFTDRRRFLFYFIILGCVYTISWSSFGTLLMNLSQSATREMMYTVDPIMINRKNSKTEWEIDSLRIQNYFLKTQLLSDDEKLNMEQREKRECPQNITYVMEDHDFGHFSSIHVIAHSFLQAKAFDYVFVPTYFRHNTISERRCRPRALYGCMFKDIVGCKVGAEEPVVKRKSPLAFKDLRWSKETEQEIIARLKERSGVKGNYGVGFYYSEAVKFVTRPDDALLEHMERMRNETIGETPLNRVMGVQMRLFGDKLGRFKEITEDSFAQAIVQLEMVHGQYEKIWVATNAGPKAVENLRAAIQKISGGDDNDRVVASPGKFWSAHDLPQEKLADTNAVLAYLNKNQNTSDWDEALSLQAEMTLLSQGGMCVGNLESNVGRYLWEASAAYHKTSQPNFFDLYGSPYFAGWAASPFPHKRLKVPQAQPLEQLKVPQAEARPHEYHEAPPGFKMMMGKMPEMDSLQSCIPYDERTIERTRGNLFSAYPSLSSETQELEVFRDFVADAQHIDGSPVCQQYEFVQDLNPDTYTGLGSRLAKMTTTFGYALNHGLAFTAFGAWGWTDEKVCPSRDHACYFQQPSGCNSERSVINMTQDKGHYGQVDWKSLSERFDLSPFRMNSELLSYLIQPNSRMQDDIELAEKLLNWHDLPRPILTVHVRHGKKIGESKYYSTEDYLRAVEIMKQRHGFKSVFLVTDDRNATNTFELEIPKLGFDALVSLDDAKYEQSGWRGGNGAFDRDAHLRIISGKGNPCFEAVSTMLNVYVGAKADGFVGTFNSNMGLMIVKLMYARNGVVLPNVSLDNFLTSAHRGSCWLENICEGRTNILVKTRSDDYPMTTSILG